MKRLLAALLLAAVALTSAAPSSAATYRYAWQDVKWATDSLYFYIPAGTAITDLKYSNLIPIPENAYWPAVSDSIPFFIISATISAAGAATDTLALDYQWTIDGTTWVPTTTTGIDWDLDSQVHVGAGLAWSFRYVFAGKVQPLYTAAGVGDWAAGVPDTYRFTNPLRGARGLRLIIHPSETARTLNGKLSARIAFPVLTSN
jgi:hypothetical protein